MSGETIIRRPLLRREFRREFLAELADFMEATNGQIAPLDLKEIVRDLRTVEQFASGEWTPQFQGSKGEGFCP